MEWRSAGPCQTGDGGAGVPGLAIPRAVPSAGGQGRGGEVTASACKVPWVSDWGSRGTRSSTEALFQQESGFNRSRGCPPTLLEFLRKRSPNLSFPGTATSAHALPRRPVDPWGAGDTPSSGAPELSDGVPTQQRAEEGAPTAQAPLVARPPSDNCIIPCGFHCAGCGACIISFNIISFNPPGANIAIPIAEVRKLR